MEEKSFKTVISELVAQIEDNMTRCNVGDVIGPLYGAGYTQGVNDVLKMIKEKLNQE